MTEDWTAADDAVEEVREIRRQIWARFDNDPDKVSAYYMELERQHSEEKAAALERDDKGKSAA